MLSATDNTLSAIGTALWLGCLPIQKKNSLLVGIKKWPTTAYKFESNVSVTIVACRRERVKIQQIGFRWTIHFWKATAPTALKSRPVPISPVLKIFQQTLNFFQCKTIDTGKQNYEYLPDSQRAIKPYHFNRILISCPSPSNKKFATNLLFIFKPNKAFFSTRWSIF